MGGAPGGAPGARPPGRRRRGPPTGAMGPAGSGQRRAGGAGLGLPLPRPLFQPPPTPSPSAPGPRRGGRPGRAAGGSRDRGGPRRPHGAGPERPFPAGRPARGGARPCGMLALGPGCLAAPPWAAGRGGARAARREGRGGTRGRGGGADGGRRRTGGDGGERGRGRAGAAGGLTTGNLTRTMQGAQPGGPRWRWRCLPSWARPRSRTPRACRRKVSPPAPACGRSLRWAIRGGRGGKHTLLQHLLPTACQRPCRGRLGPPVGHRRPGGAAAEGRTRPTPTWRAWPGPGPPARTPAADGPLLLPVQERGPRGRRARTTVPTGGPATFRTPRACATWASGPRTAPSASRTCRSRGATRPARAGRGRRRGRRS